MVDDSDSSASQSIQDEITELERRLEDAKARLSATNQHPSSLPPSPSPPLHPLLLLADSALPLGSFAFSAGLESYLAHTKLAVTTTSSPPPPPSAAFPPFLALSLSSFASTTLPFLLAAHRNPASLLALDDTLDASTLCPVARRASTSQGRALAALWDRSLSPAFTSTSLPTSTTTAALQALTAFTTLLHTKSSSNPPPAAHLAPLFGIIALLLGLDAHETAYVFVLAHVKALVSAAVRASVFGPYVAQKVLASVEVREGIESVVAREWGRDVEEAGQRVPVLDLWVGRHECLYSRIFNS